MGQGKVDGMVCERYIIITIFIILI